MRTSPDAVADIAAAQPMLDVEAPTMREAVILARRGQGVFRERLLSMWAGKCAVTKFSNPQLLRASHIKPWRDCSTNAERLDPYNGLLLNPALDAAFDRGLISFSDSGAILISPMLCDADTALIGISPAMRLLCVFDESRAFFTYHRGLHGFGS